MHYLLALFAGGVIHLGLAPYNYWLAGFAGILVFSALVVTAHNAKKIFCLAFSFGSGLFIAGTSWVYVSIHTYGQVPAPLATLFTAGFGLFLALLFALPWLLFSLTACSKNLKIVCFPIFWFFSEWLRGWLLTGFPWLYLGYAHVEGPLAGLIPIVGVLGAGVFLAISASLLIYLVDQRSLKSLIVSSAGILLIFGGGLLLQKHQWTSAIEVHIPITMVQPDIPLRDKWDPMRSSGILEVLETQSAETWQPGLLIWPEAAIPYTGSAAENYLEFLESLTTASGTAMFTGYLSYDSEQQRYLNSIVGLGAASSIYHKQRLVPFGEYVPLENWLRGTMHFFDLPMSIITRGPADQAPLTFDYLGQEYSLAPALCYEIAYSGLVRKISQDANLLITLSNDTWFGSSIGPWQHMQIAQARALENQKPLIRVTNNGITGLVNDKGETYAALPQFQQNRLQNVVQPRDGKTPYALLGNLPLSIISILIVLVCLYRSWKQRQYQSRMV